MLINPQQEESDIIESSELAEISPMSPRIATTLQDINNEYEAVINDVEKLRAADRDTVVKYFGESDIFSPETVADKVYASKITFLGSESDNNGNNIIIVHVCTSDYNKLSSDYQKLVDNESIEEPKKEVVKNLINGDYDIHYNIPVKVIDGEVQISESFKQAITGGWYTGVDVNLTPVDCVVTNE